MLQLSQSVRRAVIPFYSIRLLSQSGQGIFIAALFVVVGGSDHLAAGLSGVLVAMMAASLIAGIPGGMLADRLGPVRGLIGGSWARVLVTAAAVLLVANPVVAVGLALAYSIVSQVFSSAELAFIRHLDAARPARGHALLVVFQYAGQSAGLLIFAPLLHLAGGTQLMFAAAFACYLVVGILSLCLRIGPVAGPARVVARTGISIGPTLRFFGTERWAGYSAVVLTFFELVVKVMVVALPVLAIEEMGLGKPALGILGAAAIAGGGVGFIWAANMRPARAEEVLRPMMVAVDATSALFATASHGFLNGAGETGILTGLVPLALVSGLTLTLAPIAARAVLTGRAPIEQQARVFATQGFATNLAVVIPLALLGVSTEVAGAGTTFWLLAVVGAASIAAFELLGSPAPAPELVPQRPSPEPVLD